MYNNLERMSIFKTRIQAWMVYYIYLYTGRYEHGLTGVLEELANENSSFSSQGTFTTKLHYLLNLINVNTRIVI